MRSWLPWQYLLRIAARRRGFIDPIELLARMRRFAQPSEVHEPIELVRAGVLFHARGLINTKVFQFNLDWVWPFWVVRQFDPGDASFLPRAFSFSHVNLTHRNWTALGLPGMNSYPIVDPRGLVTLPDDPWSLDWWFIPEEGSPLYPSKYAEVTQQLQASGNPRVTTRVSTPRCEMESAAWVESSGPDGATAALVLEAAVRASVPGHLVLAARPANPEGVHFIEDIRFHQAAWTVNGHYVVAFGQVPQAMMGSTYAHGDLAGHPVENNLGQKTLVKCSAGMATAAAGFRVEPGDRRRVRATVELEPAVGRLKRGTATAHRPILQEWGHALRGVPRLTVPEPRWTFLFEAALQTVVLLSPGEIYPGPSTYRRFWFRDACLVMHAMLAANLNDRVASALERFPQRQRADGYFHSQEGEWDANGQVLWIADRFEACTGLQVSERLYRALASGAAWIPQKRRGNSGQHGHRGLLPPGFSAEHLGPVDQYYWDDLWGVAGLRSAVRLAGRRGDPDAQRWSHEQEGFADDLRASLARIPERVGRRGVPASPGRRMDSGAIGSMVADYPLQLDDIISPALALRTADWLWRNSRYGGGFFQDMIHSGINAYLTLALAQTFLRHGDTRHLGLMDTVAAAATVTGQWPEAIHPRTGGGCMGDGQHTWAAAEWILAVRAVFLREEQDHLVIGAGIRRSWLASQSTLYFGPTQTRWGPVAVKLHPREGGWEIGVDAQWRVSAPRIEVRVPGFATAPDLPDGRLRLQPVEA